MACGEIGLHIEYFYSLTPREFNNILEGYRLKEETQFQNQWEIGRLIAFNAAFNFETKDKNINPLKWMPFPWEEEIKEKPVSYADVMNYMNKKK